ncbi:hypothetical protein S245_070213, partial [Arachis hypogaea]
RESVRTVISSSAAFAQPSFPPHLHLLLRPASTITSAVGRAGHHHRRYFFFFFPFSSSPPRTRTTSSLLAPSFRLLSPPSASPNHGATVTNPPILPHVLD